MASTYRYEHFSWQTLLEDATFAAGAPAPGDPFPGFDLPTTDGGRVRRSDFVGSRPMLMVAASYT
jgi:hypothetical protein